MIAAFFNGSRSATADHPKKPSIHNYLKDRPDLICPDGRDSSPVKSTPIIVVTISDQRFTHSQDRSDIEL